MTDTAPPDPSLAPRRRRRRILLISAVVLLVILFGSLKTLASVWTDQMWFSSVQLSSVWAEMFRIKVGLFVSFAAVFFLGVFVNLYLCDSIGRKEQTLEADDEFVRRFQELIHPISTRVYLALALLCSLIAGATAVPQWRNWILLSNSVTVGATDPQFHKDLSFYLFKLPFYSFVVNWFVVSLVAVLALTGIFHYLNGGIRLQRVGDRVSGRVKVHLSVLLALIAIGKAVAYYLQPYALTTAQNGPVEGATYTDVHARIPAIHLLLLVSIAAAGILLVNIRRKGWALPVLAGGLWALVAVVVGVIYPTALQALKVTPDQSTLEKPYIQRNIEATRAAYGLGDVQTLTYAGTSATTADSLTEAEPSLVNARLWDPDASISLASFQALQAIRSYYAFQSTSIDRYVVNGKVVPVVVGVRSTNPDLQNPTWVNTHLQYTHGAGVAVAYANQATSIGNPQFAINNIPPTTTGSGFPTVTQGGVYFAVDQPGYVVADTKQVEQDYQRPNGSNEETHYKGPGGVKVGNLFRRIALALRLGDWNFLISSQITPQSRVLFVRDVVAMAQKAAPFLTIDSQPYAVVSNDGHIEWVLDGYTTSDGYPYAQNASSSSFLFPSGSNLFQGFNYVRDSVKVIVDAYSGQMTFYAWDPSDPILKVYEAAFPHLFTSASQLPADLLQHIRYPSDLISTEAAVWGRYHIASAGDFYSAADAWNISPTPGVGSYSSINAVSQEVANEATYGVQADRMAPLFQVEAAPGSTQQSFEATEAFVPASNNDRVLNLAAVMMVDSDPGPSFGRLVVYVTPPNHAIPGPETVSSAMLGFPSVSQAFTLLNKEGSQVLLSNLLMIPVNGSVLYLRPVYVSSSANLPQLKYVIADYNNVIGFEPTLQGALDDVFGASAPSVPSGGSAGTGPISGQIRNLIAQAIAASDAASVALHHADLGAYQHDNEQAANYLSQAEALLLAEEKHNQPTTKSTSTTTTTTTPVTTTTQRASTSSTTTTAPTTTTKPSTTTTAAQRAAAAVR